MLREAIAAVLILLILGVVVRIEVSGFVHIALVLTAALLSLVLVRRSKSSADRGSER